MAHDKYIMNHNELFFYRAAGLINHRLSGNVDNDGFSLVELITVIGIISALAAICLPAYNNYVNNSKNARAMSEIRLLSTEVTSYTLDNNGNNPPNLAAIGRNNFLDPWLRPYVYTDIAGGGTPLMDPFNISPLNDDFDMYSRGIDGLSTTAGGNQVNNDDIVRSNNGTFVGMRETFY